jgi:acetoin utilization protein AcuB
MLLVENWMSSNVIMLNADDSMLDATKLMKEHKIRRLPVLEKGKLVGIVTDRDLKRASPSDATALEAHELLYLIANIQVREIMTKNPISVPYDYTIEEAAEILLQAKISGMPVVDKDGEVIGMITQTDLFKVLISLTGVGKKGVQFAFLLEDHPGSIKEVADIIRSYGGRMASILSSYEKAPEGHRYVYIRTYDVDNQKMPQLKEDLKKKAKVLYMVDSRENKREIFVR